MIYFENSTIPIVSLRKDLGGEEGYDKDNDCIIITKLKRSQSSEEEIVGLVIDRVIGSPEIPKRCLHGTTDKLIRTFDRLTSHVVHPEQGNERGQVLMVLDMAAIAKRILKEDRIESIIPTVKSAAAANRG